MTNIALCTELFALIVPPQGSLFPSPFFAHAVGCTYFSFSHGYSLEGWFKGRGSSILAVVGEGDYIPVLVEKRGGGGSKIPPEGLRST
jgi:hypothetical protein